MSELWIVFEREFLSRVRTRGFVISTLLFPVFMAAIVALPAMIGQGGGRTELVVVDAAPAPVGESFVALLTAPRPAATGDDDEAPTFSVERETRPLEAARADLLRRVEAKEIDGFVVLPADVLTRGAIEFRGENVSNFTVVGALRAAAQQAVQAERMRAAGLDPAAFASVTAPVRVTATRITAQGEERGSGGAAFLVSYLAGFLTYMLIILNGTSVMRSVLEEKTSRIAEVVISSMSAQSLMLGKILGVGASVLLQVTIWAAAGALLTSRTDFLAAQFNVPPESLSVVSIPPGTLLAMIAFIVLGFLLYATLFAAVGAAVTSEQEAQSYQWFALMPLFVALIFFVRVIGDPAGGLAQVLGLIPFTAPIVMSMRVGVTSVPTSEVLLSIAGLVASIVLISWIAGKIYRVGILSTGKKASLGEIVRWIRAA